MATGVCKACNGKGSRRGGGCSECNSRGYTHSEGEETGVGGKPDAVKTKRGPPPGKRRGRR